MANPAVVIVFFVGHVVKGHQVHPGQGVGHFFIRGRGFHEHIVRLIALHAGHIFYFFDQLLLGRLVTAFTGKRAGRLVFSCNFPMTFNAGPVGGLAHGTPVLLGLLQVTVPAGALFTLGIEKRLGIFVVLVMTHFAFLAHGFGMAIVQGFIHTDRLPGRNHRGLRSMTFTAFERTAFFFSGSGFFMTVNAVVVINIHHFLPGGVFQPHIFGGHPFFSGLRVLGGQMTGRTVFVLLFQRFGVPLVQIGNGRPLQFAKNVH